MIRNESIDLVIAQHTNNTWKECLRVLKFGSFIFVLSYPRQDVMSKVIVNLQDVGFKTGFTSIYYTSKFGVEVVIVAMKPLSEKSYIDQAMKDGKGISWFDDCRIPYEKDDNYEKNMDRKNVKSHWGASSSTAEVKANNQGRFPANLLVSDDVLNDGKITGAGYTGSGKAHLSKKINQNVYNKYEYNAESLQMDSGSFSRYFDLDKWWEKRIENFPKSSDEFLKLVSYLITLSSRENDVIFNPAKIDSIKIACKTLNRKLT